MKSASHLYQRFIKTKNKRNTLESTWRECYEFALPQREGLFNISTSPTDRLFDGTAPDCVDQLAASMLSELVPAWTKWFDLMPGVDLSENEATQASPVLAQIGNIIQSHLDHSSFSVEIHQCFLDLITAGTACILFEEAPIGSKTAFKFTAVPLSEIYAQESNTGKLDTIFRQTSVSPSELLSRFPEVSFTKIPEEKETHLILTECVYPEKTGGYHYCVFVSQDTDSLLGETPFPIIKEGFFETSPFIVFRWLKAPGETYGRSPVMKALPDIKTANKVVELTLKNATIAVAGIWQAEDDGVLNPANIRLIPGAIIPKAQGSKGLTPLQAAGDFDVSSLVLEDLRTRIRHALLADKLGQLGQSRMTATEVIERSDEMVRILGATYNRIQSELLNPLLDRCLSILRRRGLIPELVIDGQLAEIQYKSPLIQRQMENSAKNALTWLNALSELGANGLTYLNVDAFINWLAQSLGVPLELVKKQTEGAEHEII